MGLQSPNHVMHKAECLNCFYGKGLVSTGLSMLLYRLLAQKNDGEVLYGLEQQEVT